MCNLTSCGTTAALMFVGWLLITSGLLFLSWNHVVVKFTKLKKGKYWQALLILLTLVALCPPMGGKGKCYKHCCKKGGCEYSKKADK